VSAPLSPTMKPIAVDLAGQTFRQIGLDHLGARAVGAALSANGARLASSATAPDLLLASFALRPDEAELGSGPLIREVEALGEKMRATGHGRIIFLLSALGVVPMRRFPHFSAAMASVAFSLRTLAMTLGPHVLVNGVAAGALTDAGERASGDDHMLSHVALGRAGGLADLTNAALFLADPLNSYTTGQLLVVDGGWSAGYGRNF
jgi:NAD(P)-dependent dehydrogenase (short-subunit alcohol dehydrogenase family)